MPLVPGQPFFPSRLIVTSTVLRLFRVAKRKDISSKVRVRRNGESVIPRAVKSFNPTRKQITQKKQQARYSFGQISNRDNFP